MSTEFQETIAPRFPSESWDLIDVVTPTVQHVKLDAGFLSMHRIKNADEEAALKTIILELSPAELYFDDIKGMDRHRAKYVNLSIALGMLEKTNRPNVMCLQNLADSV